jgi:hypothetical protein
MIFSGSYEEKVVGQFPFVYKINEEYVAIGSGVCKKVPGKYSKVNNLYNEYLECMTDRTDRMRAWDAFRKLMQIALSVRDEQGSDKNALNTLKTTNF